MASLFKPPDSTRRNGKSPKLSLPPMLRNNNNNGIATTRDDPHASSLDHLQGVTPPYSSSEVTIPRQNQTPPSSSSSIYARTPSKPMKKRPLPPPIPSSVLSNLKESNHVQPPVRMEKMTSSLSKLQISESQATYSKQELTESTESYPSAVISAYDSHGGSPTSIESRIAGKDIDQLDEDVWEHPMLKNQIETLGVLGEGAGGAVAKCKLKNGGNKIFALKTINTLNTDPEYQKQIFRELQFNKSFESDYIVKYYGMFADQQNSTIYIAMEYMGGRSLDAIYKNLSKRGGRISEKVLGKIAEAVLRGLSYLHERKIIHRDIKPQNILLNQAGQVKLCDFGVSGEAVNSLATTFTGTSYYMAPERIKGQPYSVTCDVWSLGLTLLEVAQGKFPFGSDRMATNVAPIELLTMILTFTPELKDEPELDICWSKAFKSFIEYCLKKEARERPSPRQMINHPWIQGQMKKKTNMAKFVNQCWEGED
ncbi:probable MAP kinase kinase MKK2/SSP33 [Zygosaccharomyces bailii]|nr:probable MAP kinase kinase MKK2/SSP33 [Zygosaccharomyces bailii]